MARRAVVIGSGYGDEGKGLVTDALSTPDTLVCRMNGGSQAGHSVQTPDGQRHVFHHFSSGTLRHASTFLSKFFIVNPIFFLEEAKQLSFLGVDPKVSMDPECNVTTPWDMMINHAIEKRRGIARHGSCGAGINETVQRSKKDPLFRFTVRDIFGTGGGRRAILNGINEQYVPKRMAELGLTEEDLPHRNNSGILNQFIQDCEQMLEDSAQVPWAHVHHEWKGYDIVFEGAQGLRLDQDSPDFPYVTHSKTGITNVLTLLKEAGDLASTIDANPLDIFYVSRCYSTRHGAGPFPGELERPPYEKIVDKTNIPNPHQGSLRFAYLDLQGTFDTIKRDLAQVPGKLKNLPRFVLTCVDQLDTPGVLHIQNGPVTTHTSLEDVWAQAYREGLRLLLSRGPTRETLGLEE